MSDRACKGCRLWMASAEYADTCYACCQAELTTLRSQLAEARTQLTALMSGEPEVHQLRAAIATLKQGTQVLEQQQRELQDQLAAKEEGR